jgi:transcriptional regulator with XRE-family HTH domain
MAYNPLIIPLFYPHADWHGPIIGDSDMAKRKVRARPGALLELLRSRGMTQVDAADPQAGSGVDRKTLAKINRGEEVKLETLQQVATRLQVLVSYFLETSPAADQTGGSFDPAETVMLRRLNAKRLAELIKGAQTVEWLLNVQVMDNEVRGLLQDLDSAVNTAKPHKLYKYNLRHQLSQLKAVDSLADLLQELAKHRLAVLGAEYLRWDRSISEKNPRKIIRYSSDRRVLLSVDPSSRQSRRVPVDPGAQPPKSAPPSSFTKVFVDGRELERLPPPPLPDVRKLLGPRPPPVREIEIDDKFLPDPNHPLVKKRED